jgi:hypothetical protein
MELLLRLFVLRVTMPLGSSKAILYGLLSVAILSAPAQLAAQSKGTLGPVGTQWGGQHVSLEVTDQGAQLEFDCANGTLPNTLNVDAKGNFTVKGEFTREHPGPVMRDGNPAASATYTGTIQGNTLHLHIASGPQSESVGDYVLVKDQPGRVVKCK